MHIKSCLSFLLLIPITLSLQAQSVSKHLLELESNTKWEAVDANWSNVRGPWVSKCQSDTTPQSIMALLLQFESNLKWEFVDGSWTSRRTGWIQEGNQASDNSKVSKLLLELEANMKWAALDDHWRERRNGWVSELKALTQSLTKATSMPDANNPLNIPSVVIGTQTWMSENLNVAQFRNGLAIPEARTPEAWKQAIDQKQPAWCYYDNDPANGRIYGKLYNWYAVSSGWLLAPEGWHIPTDAEWTVLSDFLGGPDTAGYKMKTTTGWKDGGNGSNESGFSALPGGSRFVDQTFSKIGEYGYWWSRTIDAGSNLIQVRHINQYNGLLWENLEWIEQGFSVRCVKD